MILAGCFLAAVVGLSVFSAVQAWRSYRALRATVQMFERAGSDRIGGAR